VFFYYSQVSNTSEVSVIEYVAQMRKVRKACKIFYGKFYWEIDPSESR
jgi:hypothetical protein